MNLTPYDTGAVAEPHVWTSGNPEDLGLVDFDNDAGETLATVRMVKNAETGGYTLWVETYIEGITTEVF